MPSGYPFVRSVRWDFFDRVCLGVSIRQAACEVGAHYSGGAMLEVCRYAKVAVVSVWPIPGIGRGRVGGAPACGLERVEIMRGRDAGLGAAEIAR
jgi:hypothetical protein